MTQIQFYKTVSSFPLSWEGEKLIVSTSLAQFYKFLSDLFQAEETGNVYLTLDIVCSNILNTIDFDLVPICKHFDVDPNDIWAKKPADRIPANKIPIN